ncbi:hypothetical protein JCM10908_004595 [Rhodotorula pacifica]|uniref:fungal specific transcription factor domain-containing protein n=1 Tax=Rhodotorula pacifica TaxID=1495444 RepID=UPI00317DF998
MQQHPLAALSSAARYAAQPVRTTESGASRSNSANASFHASPEAYHPPPHRHSSPLRTGPGAGVGEEATSSSSSSFHQQQQQSAPKRRRTTTMNDGDRTSEEPHPNKKLKVLSCTECKCDRKLPCLACCKRGEPEACKWPDELDKAQVDVQPFALTGDLLVLAQRIQSIEEWAQTLPPELRETAPIPTRFEPSLYGTTSKQKAQELGTSVRHRPTRRAGTISKTDGDEDQLYDAPSRELSETEDAAIQLESMAFASRMPDSHYRPVDNLPLLDSAASPSTAAMTSRSGPDPREAARELTAWGTSIVAYPLVYEGPWSGPALGLDVCFSLEDLRANYKRSLESIWAHMPDRALSTKLLTKYFEEIAWLHPVLHRETAEAEHERAWEMIEKGRQDEIDPMWLSCYFILLALSLDGLRSNERDIRLTPEELLRCDTTIWYGCAHRLLQLGNAVGRPQVRVIMAVILIGQWLQSSSATGRVTSFLNILAAAIRTAQILGLHQLTADPAHMPPPDPAWPPVACSMRRETALRIFHMLLFYDCLSAATRFRAFLLDLRYCSTPEPSNLDWSQMSITDWRISPKPRSVYTDMSFEYAKHRSCEAYRLAFDKLLSTTTELDYSTILELDRMYRAILQECLQALQSPPSDAHATGVTTIQRKRWMCEDGLHSRLIRLHRPFMTQYETSRKACIESATQLLKIHKRIAPVSRAVWFIYVHCLSAAICLFVDLFRAIDQDRPREELDEKRAILAISLDVFGHHDQVLSPTLNTVIKTGYGILRGLFEASDLRRTTRAAQALVGPKGKQPEPTETFAAVLQRLTRQLAIETQPVSAPLHGNGTAGYPSQPPPNRSEQSVPSVPARSSNLAAMNPSSAFDPSTYNLGSVNDPSTFANGGDASSYMPNEFFRDVGLTPGIGFNLDYLTSGDTTMLPPTAAGAAYPSGNGTAPFDPLQGINGVGVYDWPAFAAGEATGEQGKLAASALMDQLATGMW